MAKLYKSFLICALVFISTNLFSQVELVPVSNKVYSFLDRMNTNKVIEGFSESMLPVSRREVGSFLTHANSKRNKLTASDKKILDEYLVEFEFDTYGTLKNSSNFFSKKSIGELFHNKKQKYLYSSVDSNSSFFIDAIGDVRYIGGNGDSLGKPHVLLGQFGLRFRGTLFKSLGYYLRLSNGVRLGGNEKDAMFAASVDPILGSTKKFKIDGSKNFDTFEGYLRYSTSSDWLSVTAGREALRMGNGFIDKIFISNNNSAPFDFIKADIHYKKLRYTFLHSSIVGNDSSGNQLESKYFVFHRLEAGPFFNNTVKFGFTEMLVYSNVPINFALLNPLSFITSADLNSETPNKNSNNTIIGLDFQLYPARKISVQGTLLIDDLNFETLGSDSTKGNDNKFGYQMGLMWQDAFTLPNLSFAYEFTRLDPFVYSHKKINNSVAHWDLPLGHGLNPNSDEHAFKLAFDFGSRVSAGITFKLQRSGENYSDSLGNFKNVGSNILIGSGDFVTQNVFLNGLRVDRTIIIAELVLQPIKQYYLFLKYQYRNQNYVASSKKVSDSILFGGLRIDY